MSLNAKQYAELLTILLRHNAEPKRRAHDEKIETIVEWPIADIHTLVVVDNGSM